MKQFKSLILSGVYLICTLNINAQITERPRPAEWSNLVFGGRFMDRFLPMPNIGKLTCDTWGADKRITPLRAYPPIQGNFAVIDVEKNLDKGSDIHSSKNISIPLTVGRLLTILDKKPISASTKPSN